MNPVADFLASEPHFVDHLAPMWRALALGRGAFWVPRALLEHARRRGVPGARPFEPARVEQALVEHACLWRRRVATRRGRAAFVLQPAKAPVVLRWSVPARLALTPTTPVVVASHGDLRAVANGRRPLALCEHGVGQSYGNGHPSYCGGVSPERAQVGLFLVPNDDAAAANRRVYPCARIAVVGVPRLDPWLACPPRPPGPPLVAVSFHWSCRVAPETQGAFAYFRSALPALARRFHVLGHGHPRILEALARGYRRHDIEVVRDFESVLLRAALYVTDNSSTLYEFAATGRPVVVLNPPWYRRHVEHGLRFWQHAGVGLACEQPEDLVRVVEMALGDPPEQQRRRQAAVEAVIPFRDGQASARAASALRTWLGLPG